jgi:hypothetical protein
MISETRDSCLDCVRKHLAQAEVLMGEARQGYPLHRWRAVGHMAEAGDECCKDYPKLSSAIRKHRIKYMADPEYMVPVEALLKMASDLVSESVLDEAMLKVSKNKPFEKYGINWIVKRGKRPVTRRRGKARGAGRQVMGMAVEPVWIVYADGKEVWHDNRTLKNVANNIAQMIGYYGQEKSDAEVQADVEKLVAERKIQRKSWDHMQLKLEDVSVSVLRRRALKTVGRGRLIENIALMLGTLKSLGSEPQTPANKKKAKDLSKKLDKALADRARKDGKKLPVARKIKKPKENKSWWPW